MALRSGAEYVIAIQCDVAGKGRGVADNVVH